MKKYKRGRLRYPLIFILIGFNAFFSIHSVILNLIAFIFSVSFAVFGLYYGSEAFVSQMETVGKRYGLSGKTVGVLLVGMGSVFDEIFVTVLSASSNLSTLGFGNIQGSIIVTLLPFLFILPFILKESPRPFFPDGLFLMCSAGAVFFVSLLPGVIPSYVAVVFFMVFGGYIALSRRRRVAIELEPDDSVQLNPLLIVLSIVLLYFSSENIVLYTGTFSNYLGIPLFVSGFIIVGVAGSLPEIFMASITLIRKRSDMTVGVIVSSTIYKLTLVTGILTSFGSLEMHADIWSVYVVLVLSLTFLLYTAFQERKIASAISYVGGAAAIILIWHFI